MRPIVERALKRTVPEETEGGGRKSPSFVIDLPERAKKLAYWIDHQSQTFIMRQQFTMPEKIDVIDGPSTYLVEYEPRILPQFDEGYRQRDALDLEPIIHLVERLDKAGLLDWVTENTIGSDVIRLARWSLLGDHDDWCLDGSSGSAIRALTFSDVMGRENGAPDFFTLEVGWAHDTKWWELVRHITARALKYELFVNMLERDAEWMRAEIGYKDKFDEKLLKRMSDVGIGIDDPKHIRGSLTLNGEQKISALQENRDNAEAVLEEDWMQDWWPSAMNEMRIIPSRPLKRLLKELAKKASPEVKAHLLKLPEIMIAMGRYYKAFQDHGLDISDTGIMEDEADSDIGMSWIWWGERDPTLRMSLESIWNGRAGYTIAIGAHARWIQDGKVMEDSDEHLYPVRRGLQQTLSQWLLELHSYLYPKKSKDGSTNPTPH